MEAAQDSAQGAWTLPTVVQLEQVVYMAPELLLHYILGHEYSPPEEFLEAVANGRFLSEADLEVRWR
jgi:hypothetical protein